MIAQECSQLTSPPDGQDPALQVQNILANLADTGWLEKESDAEGGADDECPDPGSNHHQDVYNFDCECPHEMPIFLETNPPVRRRNRAAQKPVAANQKNALLKSKEDLTLAQRRRAYILHDEDSSEQQLHQKDAAAAEPKDVLATQNIGSLCLQHTSAASQERQSSKTKGLNSKVMSHGLGERNIADQLPEQAPKHRRKRKGQEHKENAQEMIINEVEDAGGPFPILPDFSAKNLAMLRPDVLLRPPGGRPIHRPVPMPESLLLPLPLQHSTQLCTPRMVTAKLLATSQSPLLSLERSDRALAAEASMHCVSGLPPRSEGPASTAFTPKQFQPDSHVSTRPVKGQNRQRAPHRLPTGRDFLRASELLPVNSKCHAAKPQSVHGCAPVRHEASTGKLQGISLPAHASACVMDAKHGSQKTGSQSRRSSAAMQSQNRDQLGVFAECDSEDEDLALDYNLLDQRAAEAAGTSQHVLTASQCLPPDPSSTIGGMQSDSVTGLTETAEPQMYGMGTCGHANTGCPAAVSLREAVHGPHPYEALARKAAAQLGDRPGGSNGPASACQVVFADEDEPGQGMDEHWPGRDDWQQAALHDKARQATALWPTASGLQLVTSQPASAAVQTTPCPAQSSLTGPPRLREARGCGNSWQEQQPRQKKDLASFDLLDRLDFEWGSTAQPAQPANPVASNKSGAGNQMQWNAHGSKAVEGFGAHAEDRQCEIVFMDEEAPAPVPAVFTEREWRASTAVGASDAPARQMRHKNKTALRQPMVSKVLGIDRWTNIGITGQVATRDQPEPSSPCQIVFADCTD